MNTLIKFFLFVNIDRLLESIKLGIGSMTRGTGIVIVHVRCRIKANHIFIFPPITKPITQMTHKQRSVQNFQGYATHQIRRLETAQFRCFHVLTVDDFPKDAAHFFFVALLKPIRIAFTVDKLFAQIPNTASMQCKLYAFKKNGYRTVTSIHCVAYFPSSPFLSSTFVCTLRLLPGTITNTNCPLRTEHIAANQPLLPQSFRASYGTVPPNRRY